MGSRNILVCCIIVLVLGMIMAAAADQGANKYNKDDHVEAGKQQHYNNKYKYPKKAKCSIGKYKHCYNVEHNCPETCPGSCVVDCVSCKPICSCDKPGAVCQDPRFVGADGVTFYYHGKKDGDFCLVSDANLHINGHFIGKRNPAMSRDFTWVQSIGILFDDHRIFVGAEKTATWDDSVDQLSLAFDGERVSLPATQGATWRSHDGVSFTRSSRAANAVTVEAEGRFKIEAVVVPITEEESRVHGYGIVKEEEDCMAHLDLAFKFYSLTKDVNGVLGQTYAEDYVSKVKISAAMPVVGGNDKFSTTDLFAPDCAASRFVRGIDSNVVRVADQEHSGLDCSSGLGRGTGIVCKK